MPIPPNGSIVYDSARCTYITFQSDTKVLSFVSKMATEIECLEWKGYRSHFSCDKIWEINAKPDDNITKYCAFSFSIRSTCTKCSTPAKLNSEKNPSNTNEKPDFFSCFQTKIQNIWKSEHSRKFIHRNHFPCIVKNLALGRRCSVGLR